MPRYARAWTDRTVKAAAGAEADTQPAADATPKAGEKDTRLSMEDLRRMRRQRMSPQQVANRVAEQGRGFEVTADITRELRGLGFRPAQIDAVKGSSRESLVPGKWLTTSDGERDETFKEMKQVAVESGAAIEPIESQHVTLWAAKETQRTYLPDIEELERFFHTKCAEPIRSGLDKRSTHVVLLKDHAEYEAWWRTMFRLFGKQFDEKDNPGGNAHFREEIPKLTAFYGWDVCTISVAGTAIGAPQRGGRRGRHVRFTTGEPAAATARCNRDSSMGRRPS